MYSTNKRIIAIILVCNQLLTLTSCNGNFIIPVQHKIAHEPKKVSKKQRQEDLSVAMPNELAFYAGEIEVKKQILKDQSSNNQLQLI